MAAASICEQASPWSYELHVFEKNSLLWNKVLISGGGRCNVTTGYYKKQDFLDKYIRGSDFIKDALAVFWPRKVYKWFEDHGVPLKIEDDMRVFPISNNGKDVVWVFEKIFAEYWVVVHFKEGVEKLTYTKLDSSATPENDGFVVDTAKDSYDFDVVVLTTGGNAYAHTGSTGDGYSFAAACGHSITPLGPSLNSFMTTDAWMHELSGLSFADAVLRVRLGDGTDKDTHGPVLLTHFGISWPATFVLAAYTAFETVDETHPLTAYFQPFQDMDASVWNTFFLDASMRSPKKRLSTILAESPLPKRFAAAFVQRFASDITIGVLSKKDRQYLSGLLWNGIPLACIKRRPGDEFVTAGGVALEEVDSSTLESKTAPWLYFAGEILDVDGVTGWFNLQACWAAGYVVGKSIASTI